MGIGDLSQCEKLSKCKVANEHRRVLAVRRFFINFNQKNICQTILHQKKKQSN